MQVVVNEMVAHVHAMHTTASKLECVDVWCTAYAGVCRPLCGGVAWTWRAYMENQILLLPLYGLTAPLARNPDCVFCEEMAQRGPLRVRSGRLVLL